MPKAGSAYVYSYVTVGEFVAFTIGWNLILEYVIGASSVARGLSGYIDSLFNYKMEQFWKQVVPIKVEFLAEYPDIISFAIVSVLTIILAAGVKESSIVHSTCTTINLATILLVLVAGSIKANPANWAIAKDDIPDGVRGGEGGFMPYGFAGVMAGAAKCFYGFVGFDCVATAGEEAKDAKRNIPLAVILTMVICVFVYAAISTVLTMMWPYYAQDPAAPLPFIFQEIGWHEIRWIISIAAIFALFSALLGALFSLPRVCYAMGNDGVLFKILGRVHPKTKTPVIATVVSGMLSAIMAAFFSLHQLVDMLSIGTLLAYTIVAICVLVLRYEESEISDRNQITIWEQILAFKSFEKPTRFTSRVTKVAVTTFFFLSIILGCLVTFFKFTTEIITMSSICGGAMVLTILVIAQQPVDKSINISFKVPLVPLLPCLSIFCNIYLMLQLDEATWIRFGVWMIAGKSLINKKTGCFERSMPAK